MARPEWFVELLKKSFHLRFILAKLTRIPGIKFIVNKLLFEDDVIYYIPNDNILSKSKTVQVNKKVSEHLDIIVPSEIMFEFIDKADQIFQMNFCLCRTANKCENYSRDAGCLFLGKSALKINKNYGKLIAKDEAKDYIKKRQEEGLVQLIGKNKIDSQWLEAFPDKQLLTICNCCECCCLWKMLPDLDVKISRNVQRMPGIEVKIDTANCIGCGVCLESCFVNAIHMNKKSLATINENLCRGCGRCITMCKQDAIEFKIIKPGFIEKVIESISSVVDVA